MTTQHPFDLVISGGGMTGLALAIAVAGGGLSVLVIERQPLEVTTAPPFDGRVTAIARGSRQLLEAIGAWRHMAPEAQPILDIEVGERLGPGLVHYDHREVGDQAVGHIVENRVIRTALLRRTAELMGAGLTLAAPDQLVDFVPDGTAVTVDLASGGQVRAALLVAAEGRQSPTRELAGIDALSWTYDQTGIVATIGHAQPHHGLARERFFADGPLAILPMTGDRSSIVWAAERRLAELVIGLDDHAFMDELGERFGDELGPLTLAGPRWHYPLAMVQAHRYVDQRLALVGDSAHAIHPLAGQGWNLALRDVAALAELVVDARRLGLDPGSDAVLERYARWRRFDSLTLIAITDGLNRLFAIDLTPIRLARQLGLGLVERLPLAKRFFMRHAMGVIGELPRLMRGEAL